MHVKVVLADVTPAPCQPTPFVRRRAHIVLLALKHSSNGCRRTFAVVSWMATTTFLVTSTPYTVGGTKKQAMRIMNHHTSVLTMGESQTLAVVLYRVGIPDLACGPSCLFCRLPTFSVRPHERQNKSVDFQQCTSSRSVDLTVAESS